MNRVFFVEPAKQGTGNAELWGEITYIFPPDCKRVSIWATRFPTDAVEELERQKFDPHTDFVAVAGGLMALLRVVMAVTEEYGAINVLYWDTASQSYRHGRLGGNENDAGDYRALRNGESSAHSGARRDAKVDE